MIEAITRFVPQPEGSDLFFDPRAHILLVKNTRENLAATDAADRYVLVTQVEQGLVDGGGAYVCQTGSYTLTCAQGDGAAVLSFQNNGLATDSPDADATPGPDATDEPEGEDWAAQVG
jgi:hypothetical protein